MSAEPMFEVDFKHTERSMLDLLHKRYGVWHGNGRRWAVAEHVKNEAGFWASRCADFIAVDCWPGGDGSGINLHGHEVKVSRADWLTELKHPEKAEAFTRYMDRWWLVVPDASIVRDDLPEKWGLLVIDGNGKLRVKVRAAALHPEPLPKEMLATLLRATAKTASAQAKLGGGGVSG